MTGSSDRRRLHEGKAKVVWETGQPDACVIEFKDDATAFDGKKRGQIGGKGRCNNLISAALFELLEASGVPTHYLRTLGDREMLVRRLDIIPVEVVVRNVAAGSLAKRLGLEEGTVLDRPVLELCYKSDALGDPMVNRYHIAAMRWATADEMDQIEELALRVNAILGRALAECGLRLVDFKLEFGKDASGAVLLGDEVSPDTCRFWDTRTNEKLDKDRFRRDLGGVEDAYQEVLRRVTSAARGWQAGRLSEAARATRGGPGPGPSARPAAAPAGAATADPAASDRTRARVFVTLKKTVLDPQGTAVESALRSLGYEEVAGVRVGKSITLELGDASRERVGERVDEMCRRLLANPVIEDYRFEVIPAGKAGP